MRIVFRHFPARGVAQGRGIGTGLVIKLLPGTAFLRGGRHKHHTLQRRLQRQVALQHTRHDLRHRSRNLLLRLQPGAGSQAANQDKVHG